ncbi:MAG: hypothetical protein FRX49_02472 [Trebouxia sp. A1-2]|nr:MAG: hypothetical protein FRX49_02472 [Trebouxia sp. A1-2]
MGACRALSHLKAGIVDEQDSGRLGFPEGLFANGGAMRFAPVGLACRCCQMLCQLHLRERCIEEITWEGDAASQAWQNDFKVLQAGKW